MADLRHIQLLQARAALDQEGVRLRRRAAVDLQLDTGLIRCSKVFSLDVAGLSRQDARCFADDALADPVLHQVFVDQLFVDPGSQAQILVSLHPGVTDDEARSAQRCFCDYFRRPGGVGEQWIYTHRLY